MMPTKDVPSVDNNAPKPDTDIANAKTASHVNGATVGNQDAKEELKPNRILRYAEVFDLRTYETKLVKTGKPDKKLDKKKPVLVERRIINYKGVHTHTEVDIKSHALRDVLIDINKDVEGLSLKKEPPFADPALFFHSRHALKTRLLQEENAKDPDSALIADISTALRYVDEEQGKNIRSLENMLPNNEITWPLLWALFKPNAMLYHFHQYTEQHQVLRMRRMKIRMRQDGTQYWHIMCDMIADDGMKFGYTKNLGISNRPDKFQDLEIDEFEGGLKIHDLSVYPLELASDPARIRLEVIERGKKYVSMTRNTYLETCGPAMRETMNDRYEVKRFRFNTHGRAMIDTASFRANNPNTQYTTNVHSSIERSTLSDEQLMICSPFIGGFGFGDKIWGSFAISRLKEVVWTDEPFNSLVIGEKPKTMIYSLVKQHSTAETGYDDVVQGKGLGLIGLLSGNPGCGKTLTAEAVAEVAKKPLYAVSAGELGTAVEKVDKQLSLILELSHQWSAVLLLDEADVFLQERDTKDVTRNALVSIFLRQLEYFQGILILTTNRIGNCDPAFESRIHFSIHYPDLDAKARRLIWRTFLRKALDDTKIETQFSEGDLDTLANNALNGRQIKHAVGSARSIAREKQQPLDISHIESVLEVVEAWNIAKAR